MATKPELEKELIDAKEKLIDAKKELSEFEAILSLTGSESALDIIEKYQDNQVRLETALAEVEQLKATSGGAELSESKVLAAKLTDELNTAKEFIDGIVEVAGVENPNDIAGEIKALKEGAPMVEESDVVAVLTARIKELEASGKTVDSADPEEVADLEEILETICSQSYLKNVGVNRLITKLVARVVPGVNQVRVFISPTYETSDVVLADTNYIGCYEALAELVTGKHAQVISFDRNEVVLNFHQNEVLAVQKEIRKK